MNAVFNLNRFCRLFRKHSVEHYKSYLMSLSVLMGVMILGGGFLVYMVDFPLYENTQSGFFILILLLAGTIFTSTVFSDLGDRKKAIGWITLPASQFEKYLVAWLYSFFIFIIIFTLCFYIVVLFAVNLRHSTGRHSGIFNVFDRQVFEVYATYAFLHGIAICGAVWFEKMHFVKTAFVFFISVGILIFVNKLFMGALLSRQVDATPPFGNLRFSDAGNIFDINISTLEKDKFLVYFISGLAILFWIAAYRRIKEKQV